MTHLYVFHEHNASAFYEQTGNIALRYAERMSDEHVTQKLKALRESAKISLREMSRRLGVSPSTYTHYESQSLYKRDYLPMDKAVLFADILEPEGVSREAVLALAGSGASGTTETVDSRVSRLSEKRQQQMLSLLADLEAVEELERVRSEK